MRNNSTASYNRILNIWYIMTSIRQEFALYILIERVEIDREFVEDDVKNSVKSIHDSNKNAIENLKKLQAKLRKNRELKELSSSSNFDYRIESSSNSSILKIIVVDVDKMTSRLSTMKKRVETNVNFELIDRILTRC